MSAQNIIASRDKLMIIMSEGFEHKEYSFKKKHTGMKTKKYPQNLSKMVRTLKLFSPVSLTWAPTGPRGVLLNWFCRCLISRSTCGILAPNTAKKKFQGNLNA